MAKKSYQVNRPHLLFDKKSYGEGDTVQMDEDAAAPLLATGALTEPAEPEEKPAKGAKKDG